MRERKYCELLGHAEGRHSAAAREPHLRSGTWSGRSSGGQRGRASVHLAIYVLIASTTPTITARGQEASPPVETPGGTDEPSEPTGTETEGDSPAPETLDPGGESPTVTMSHSDLLGSLTEATDRQRWAAAVVDVCGLDDPAPSLVPDVGPAVELEADGSAEIPSELSRLRFTVAGEGLHIVRVRSVEASGAVLACGLIEAGGTYALPGSGEEEGIAMIEIFSLRGPGALTPAEQQRIRSIVDELTLIGTGYDERASLRDALVSSTVPVDHSTAVEIERRLHENMSRIPFPDCTELAGSMGIRWRGDVRDIVQQRGVFLRRRVASLVQHLADHDGWSATQAATSLPTTGWTSPASHLQEVLEWYTCRDASSRASLDQVHLLPLASRHPRQLRGSTPARVVVRFNRSADLRVRTVAHQDYVFIATHVPQGTRAHVDVGRTQPADQSIDSALGQFARVFISMGGSFRVAMEGVPVVPPEALPIMHRLRIDPLLPPTAQFSTISSAVNLPGEAGTTTVRICASNPCVEEGATANVRGSAVIEVEPVAEFMAIASLGAAFYVGGRQHALSATGSAGPEQLYVVHNAASSTPLAISIGLGLRVEHVILSASLVSVGVDIDPFRSWLFGTGFRIPALSRNVYFQFVAGLSRVRQFRELDIGDVISAPSGTTPTPAMGRRRVPIIGLALSFDIAGSGEAISDFVKGAIP